MWLTCFLSIDQDIVQIYNDEDIKLFSKDFIDIALKTGRSIGESKKHDLVLEIVVPGTKSSLPFVTFSNPHLMVSTGQIQLGKTLSPT